MIHTVGLTTCANCDAAMNGPFCAQCGQKAGPLNPSAGEFLHELFHEIAHLDGKIVHSIRLLLTRPGFLTREQFEGRRARYVPPIRLYLVCSILYFAVAPFAPLSGPRIACGSCPAETRAEVEREMREAVVHWTPRAMFVLVPVFAGLVALTARKARRNYPQHLYFALHLHAVWFFFGAVAGVASLAGQGVARPVNALIGAWVMLYFILSFRRAYRVSIIRSVVAPMFVMLLYLFIFSLTLIAIIIPVAKSAGAVSGQ